MNAEPIDISASANPKVAIIDAQPRRRTRTRSKVRVSRSKTVSAVEQVRLTFRSDRRLSAFMGCLIGGFIPAATFVVVHYEVRSEPWLWAFVVAGLYFSALSVFHWAKQAFTLTQKAVGFVVLLEGVVSFSRTPWLAATGLVVLVGINGISTAVAFQGRK